DAYEELINGKYGYLIKNISLDAGYMTPAICRAIVQNDQIPYMLITKLIANTVFKLNCTHN
ncbi:hypothetical protein, partial [Holdemanella biformis]|uniref:hypothetical protein n=1 Tax=Holdemanella biformis TaxID=1735 RepID=UPI0022E38ED9